MYITRGTLEGAVRQLYGTAGHLLKIWFVLKQMGFRIGGEPVHIDTSNSTDALQRLFSCGAPDHRFFVPFSHTPRYLTMKHDASRSIVQTTIQRWASSGSVVTCDPTHFIDIASGEGGKLLVRPARNYPFGLGVDESGFALHDGERVSIPLAAFSVWYGRKTPLPPDENAANYLEAQMLAELNISPSERDLVFVQQPLEISTQLDPLSDQDIFGVCQSFLDGTETPTTTVLKESFDEYARKVKGMVSDIEKPSWLRVAPSEEAKKLLQSGVRALLLFGPPRTGKTRFIDALVSRDDPSRETIQIHDGWGYDNLIQGLKPDNSGNWSWEDGPLKNAIESGKKLIVLEEINRTQITQSLGEVFSLIEETYRGEQHGIMLRDGKKLFIPEDVIFVMTMNTVDKSTEDVDDALMGRVAAIEFSPRSEDLSSMLSENGVPESTRKRIASLYAEILKVYPIGHGYFAGVQRDYSDIDFLLYYKTRIRPVLYNFLGDLKSLEIHKIDNLADQLFASS